MLAWSIPNMFLSEEIRGTGNKQGINRIYRMIHMNKKRYKEDVQLSGKSCTQGCFVVVCRPRAEHVD